MLSYPAEIIAGVRLLMKAAGINKAVIGVEANKPDAIAALSRHAGNGIDVQPLKVKYPQGGEKQLIKAITGREVPSGALPIATGAIVQNVATAYAVWEAVVLGKPLIERIVTVTGQGFTGGNYRVPLGISINRLIDLVGKGAITDRSKLILGGPMMGRAIANPQAPVTKGVSGILILDADNARRDTPQPCIRCGACVKACPMGLEPYLLATLSRHGRYDDTEQRHITDCIECGSCSYSCPAARPILDYIRLGKAATIANIRNRRNTDNR
ncbi:MAG: RnfABCDGE type electron transport complex subunit C, partial [Muribaculaceae bacterium]|nr:RnfABCDGE type electron transport complex subunit C [Muribaculaceae bacterium]